MLFNPIREIGIAEVARREVHRDRHGPRSGPGGKRLVQQQNRQRLDQARVLGELDELARQHGLA